MSPTHEIRGWCPTALHPMESGDGLLIRPKVIGACIDAAQLGAIALIAKTIGNGLIDLTQRAQFQIRGVKPSRLEDARNELNVAELLAPNSGVDRIANILMPPLAGLDGSALFDAKRLVSDLVSDLSQDTALYALPSKFLFAIQDGGELPLDISAADISIYPHSVGRLALCLAGVEDVAVIVSLEEATASVLRIARAYTELRTRNPFDLRRMRKLIKHAGVKPLIDNAGISLSRFIPHRSRERGDYLGVHDIGEIAYSGVAAPSGRWVAEDLSELADLAVKYGMNEARLTPWRAILFPAPDRTSAMKIHNQAKAMGLIVDGNDPRRSVIACPGAPECLQAQGETRGCLERLAPLARQYAGNDGVGLHISGCRKGCARQSSTPVTLVLDRGSFDLIFDGGPQDKATQTNLTLEEVVRLMNTDARVKAPCPVI